MTQTTLPPALAPAAHTTPRAWRVAGVLGLTHVVLILAALALQAHALFGEGRAGLTSYASGSLTLTVIGGYVDMIGFLVLVPMLVILARGLGRRTELGRVASLSALLAGAGYVVLTFSPGLAAGAVSMLGVQQGAHPDAAWLMNNLRVVTFVMSLVFLGAHAIALAVASRADTRAGGDGPAPRLLGGGGLRRGCRAARLPGVARC